MRIRASASASYENGTGWRISYELELDKPLSLEQVETHVAGVAAILNAELVKADDASTAGDDDDDSWKTNQ